MNNSDRGHHHNPYTKAFIYGWISPTKLASQNIIKPLPNKVYTLRPRNKFDDVYLYSLKYDIPYGYLLNYNDTIFDKTNATTLFPAPVAASTIHL